MRSCASPAARAWELFDPPAERLDIAPRKLWIALGDKHMVGDG